MLSVTRLVAALALVAPTVALAQDAPREGRQDGWSLGLLVIGDTNPYLGQDEDILPLPLISFRQGPFAVSTEGVEYSFLESGPWRLTAAARPRFSGLISTDGDQLDGIDREVTGDLALEAQYDIGRFYARGALRQEFTGEHDGQEARLRFGARQRLGTVGLDWSAGAAWQSGDLSRYIYGVDTDEVAPGRPTYDPGSVVVPFVSLSARYQINESWSLLGSLRGDFFSDDITDSPIIEDDTLVSGGVGFVFRF
ncbi:MipA/OmpV family protein [Tropicimonas sp. S265A]|uniref:MipA/OmpV family protein n=1 Tax=Tropicimonas sp. S265A TaxID=3415134 RepID=UPI003C7E6921